MNIYLLFTTVIMKKTNAVIRILFLPFLALVTNIATAQDNVCIDGKGTGRIFDGICGINAGGAVGRLLINYPEPQRSEILDFLFKPNYGASFQGYKAEIGGDGNTTEGSEPSHMHTANDENYNRGYQWWMMQEAKKRNPAIKLHVLAWDFPAWIKEVNSQATADYLVKYIQGAKKNHNLDIDYIGLWNETKTENNLIKLLRKTLDAYGFKKVKIVADDQVRNWAIADSILADKQLYNYVDIVATHYPKYESGNAKNLSKPIWSSEDGSWNDAWGGTGSQGGPLAKLLNLNYVNGRMTSTHFWCIISAYYTILDLPNAGILRAQWPWTGHYEIKSPVWVIAHTTQFAQPGWQYVDTACGKLKNGGSFVTLKKNKDFSVVIETINALENEIISFKIQNGLSGSKIYVWKSDSVNYFNNVDVIIPKNGTFTISVSKNCVYSLTTTTGQKKGMITPPAAKKFMLPYKDDFEQYSLGNTSVKYFIEQNGAYEVVNAGQGRKGKALRQVVSDSPIVWTYGHTAYLLGTASIIGDKNWVNYSVTADVLMEEPGYARVMGRVSRVTLDGQINGYQLYLYNDGMWKIKYSTTDAALDSGNINAGLNKWYTLKMVFDDSLITAFINGKKIAQLYDSRYQQGMAGIGNYYNKGLYDNFKILSLPRKKVYVGYTNTSNYFFNRIPEPPSVHDAIPLKNAIKISWDPVYGAKGYRIKMGTEKGKYTSTIDAGNLNSYTVWTLQTGQTYYFVVAAYNDKGESPATWEVGTEAN